MHNMTKVVKATLIVSQPFVIEPVISYDKCIDVMDLNKNDLICIFMNINEKVKKSRKARKKL